ncbi:MAG: DUF2461 domain-containing protein [Thermodesulfobacteriota bacterium]
MATTSFTGFPRQTLTFLRDLAANNKKEWFEAHREEYEEHFLAPAREFVLAMGGKLKKLSPGLTADPRTNQSLFRLNRDTRFSRDKSPYKTHLALWFWEGPGRRMECSGFYFHLEPDHLMLGVGIYQFPKHLVEPYRRAVVDPKQGPALAKAVAALAKDGGITIGGRRYKKVPAGYDPGHRNAGLLLHDGLYGGIEMEAPEELHSEKIMDFCLERFLKMKPLHQWLLALTQRAAEKGGGRFIDNGSSRRSLPRLHVPRPRARPAVFKAAQMT